MTCESCWSKIIAEVRTLLYKTRESDMFAKYINRNLTFIHVKNVFVYKSNLAWKNMLRIIYETPHVGYFRYWIALFVLTRNKFLLHTTFDMVLADVNICEGINK